MRILYGKVGSLLRSLLKFIGSFWARVDPILRQSASPNVPPQSHEGMALRNIGPKVFREVFQPSNGPGDIHPPTPADSSSTGEGRKRWPRLYSCEEAVDRYQASSTESNDQQDPWAVTACAPGCCERGSI
jgi:hypothetical protein